MFKKLNPFAKPTLNDVRGQELKEMEEQLYQAERQVDYYTAQIEYYKGRIRKLNEMKKQPEQIEPTI